MWKVIVHANHKDVKTYPTSDRDTAEFIAKAAAKDKDTVAVFTYENGVLGNFTFCVA